MNGTDTTVATQTHWKHTITNTVIYGRRAVSQEPGFQTHTDRWTRLLPRVRPDGGGCQSSVITCQPTRATNIQQTQPYSLHLHCKISEAWEAFLYRNLYSHKFFKVFEHKSIFLHFSPNVYSVMKNTTIQCIIIHYIIGYRQRAMNRSEQFSYVLNKLGENRNWYLVNKQINCQRWKADTPKNLFKNLTPHRLIQRAWKPVRDHILKLEIKRKQLEQLASIIFWCI